MVYKIFSIKGSHDSPSVMDDTIIDDDEKEKQNLSQCLAKEFEIKAFRRLKYFLDIEVAHFEKKNL